MGHKTEDLSRRDINLQEREIKQILPEWFLSDNPNLVKFLEYYYNFLDSDGTHSFISDLNTIHNARDTTENSNINLNQIIQELGSGITSGTTIFRDARWSAKRIGDLFRAKGTRFGAEEFFRSFFSQDEIEFEYTKNKIFKIGEPSSTIGYDSLKKIQDYALYQTYAILIKTGIDVSKWETLYKRFVHPAGWYFAGEVIAVGKADANFAAPTAYDSTGIYGEEFGIAYVSLADNTPGTLTSITGLTDSYGGNVPVPYPGPGAGVSIRYDFESGIIKRYSDAGFTVRHFDKIYSDIGIAAHPNSFTFDDSAMVGDSSHAGWHGVDYTRIEDSAGPDFSNTTETFDAEMFSRYQSDSAF